MISNLYLRSKAINLVYQAERKPYSYDERMTVGWQWYLAQIFGSLTFLHITLKSGPEHALRYLIRRHTAPRASRRSFTRPDKLTKCLQERGHENSGYPYCVWNIFKPSCYDIVSSFAIIQAGEMCSAAHSQGEFIRFPTTQSPVSGDRGLGWAIIMAF